MGKRPSVFKDSYQAMSNTLRSKIVPAITIVCAMGVAVTGTLLYVDSRPKAEPVATPTAPPSSDLPAGLPSNMVPPANMPPANVPSVGEAAPITEHEPPQNLTMGMSEAAAAVTRGNWYYDHEQWLKAIADYRRAIKAGIDNPNVRTDMGNALRFAGEPRQALDQYRIAQKQDPSHQQSLYNQGGLWAFSLNDRKQAVVAWKAYLKRFPNGQSAAEAKKFIAES